MVVLDECYDQPGCCLLVARETPSEAAEELLTPTVGSPLRWVDETRNP